MYQSVSLKEGDKNLSMVINSPASVKAWLQVTDMAGKAFLQKSLQLIKGNDMNSVVAGNLDSGVYLIKNIWPVACSTPVSKFVKQ